MKNKKEMTPLSASRIKTAESCSWLYYCGYKLRMPNPGNDGSSRGTICHLIFECLGNPRHKHTYDKLIEKGSVFASDSIKRLILKHATVLGVDDEENMQSMDDMIMNGLRYDFFGGERQENGELPDEGISEKDFDIIVDREDGVRYRVRGFIDKLFLYKKQGLAVIRDFKSSKKTFEGKELEDNLQDLTYGLAVRFIYPEYLKRRSEFLFLKFEMDDQNVEGSDGVAYMEERSEDDTDGFELYLSEVQKYVDGFNEKTAVGNFAKHKYGGGFPKDGSFSGKLQCGCFCKFHGQRKKSDGSVMWHCNYRFARDYLVLINSETNETIKSVFIEDAEELFSIQDKMKQSSRIEERHYDGCPAWKSDPDNTSTVEIPTR
tara:strand:+ start:2008 stop:3132 length:1125 start_codon:yes stop_codon:yes gene_type:complete